MNIVDIKQKLLAVLTRLDQPNPDWLAMRHALHECATLMGRESQRVSNRAKSLARMDRLVKMVTGDPCLGVGCTGTIEIKDGYIVSCHACGSQWFRRKPAP